MRTLSLAIMFDQAPARNAISFEPKIFEHLVKISGSPYTGTPSEAVDTAWRELLQCMYCLSAMCDFLQAAYYVS